MNKMIHSHLAVILFFTIILVGCGGEESSDEFQTNHSAPFELTKITEGYGAVDDAWESIDTKGFNTRLDRAVDAEPNEYELSSYCLANILTDPNEPLAEIIRTDLSNILSRLVDTQTSHHESDGIGSIFQADAETQARNFYAFLDKMDTDGIEVPDDYLSAMIEKVVLYIESCIPDLDPDEAVYQPDKAWLNNEMTELIEDLEDEDFHEDFVEITKLVSKLTNQTDYPMWLDDTGLLINKDDVQSAGLTNTEIGNAVRGTHDLVIWLNKIIQNPETNILIHQAVTNFANIFDPDKLATILRQQIINMEDHFTTGGEVYASDPIYNENSATIYSDAEIKQSLRELFPFVQQLFLRSDRPNAIISTGEGQTPVYPMDLMIENLRNIGFDPDTIDIERSIYDLMRYDIFGRDRISDSEAWPTPYLESLLFLTFVSGHHGWQDGGTTGEITDSGQSRTSHGHGSYTEELTLNDSLFSINMKKSHGYLGVYEISLKETDGNHIYRSKTPFTLSEVDELHTGTVVNDDKDYRFFYNADYGVLQFLAGPGPGDLGVPDGGNPEGQNLGINQYLAYSPNGLHETQLAAWTMGWGVRACFNGEGPYYYADPNAEVVSVDGETYRKYLRPDGKIYALVSMDGSKYLYPTDEGDVEDSETDIISFNEKRQRDNRYKSQWHSDYYIIHFNYTAESAEEEDIQNEGPHYFTLDNSSGNTVIKEISGNLENPAGSLVYNELITETDPARACASPEEAFFRNYQWVMNEKKMVIIIPQYFDAFGEMFAAAYQVHECHGYSGLANLRRYRENHVWAKKGEDGLSNIPGDYRMEVASFAYGHYTSSEINDDSIYMINIDCGNATPSIVGHNLPALYRLGFPKSPPMDRGDGITDYTLGSQEFAVGDENWNNRNAFMPILFSLMAGLRENTPAYDPDNKPTINSGMRMFLTHSPLAIKPLFYYNRDADAAGPFNSWIPRVYGTQSYGAYEGKPFLQSSGEFYEEGDAYGIFEKNADWALGYYRTPETYFGSWEERRHFQPAVLKTQLNILIDSDIISEDTNNRCDGLLPLIANETEALTYLFKLIMNPSVDTLPLEQQLSAMKYTKGELTAINESAESGKNINFPAWMFAAGIEETKDVYGEYTEYSGVRDEDIILDDILDFVIGHDAVDEANEGYGLADYPDDKSTDEDWEDFNDSVDSVCDLLYNDSLYSITPNLLYLMDQTFGRDQLYSSDEITGLLYNVGEIFGYYDTSLGRWMYQGEDGYSDVYTLMTERIPAMDTVTTQNEVLDPMTAGGPPGYYGYGDHYYAQLVFLKNMSGPDGLLEFILNDTTVSQDWETIFTDLNNFFNGYDVSNPQSLLWTTLADLLHDMGEAVGDMNNSDLLNDVFTDYGFQVN